MGFSISTPSARPIARPSTRDSASPSNTPRSSSRPPQGSSPRAAYDSPTRYAHSKRQSLPKRLSLPEYIYQTETGLLIFRMKVPLDCRPALKKKELKYSLKTHCVYTGRQHIASILHTTSDIFNRIRQGAYAEFKAEELNKVLKERIKKAILSSTAFRLTRDNFDHTHSDHTQKPIAKISVLPVDIGSSVVDTESLVNQKPIVVDTNLLGEKVTQATFTDLQYSFFKEKELSEGWRLKTKEDHASVFSLFVEVFGDLPLVEINKTTMRDFKATLVQLPPNMRKDARYRDKTVPEIIRMNPSATFSAHTINKYASSAEFVGSSLKNSPRA